MTGAAVRRMPTERDEGRRYLGHSEVAVSPRERLAVAGILRADTAADLRFDAQVNDLLPHDAILVLERTDPDLVLVESRALTGSGAWAGAGEPSVADLAARLLEILDVAGELGRPTVLWWSGPRHEAPALIPFASRFDLVVMGAPGPAELDDGWTPGVQLARFHPVGSRRDRPVHPVAHGRWDQVPARAVQAFAGAALSELVDDGLELWVDADVATGPTWLPDRVQARGVRRIDVGDRADRYREHGLFLADPLAEPAGPGPVSTSVLRQLASGARVVSGPAERLTSALAPWVELAPDPATIRAVVRAAADLGPRPAVEQRALLRTLFREHDTSRAVATLAQWTGLRGRATNRDVCVVAHLAGRGQATALADAVMLQQVRPVEALLLADDPTDARQVIAELERAGIAGQSLPPGAAGQGLMRRAADRTSATWLWPWSAAATNATTFLVDAVAAGLMTGAAAVGHRESGEDGFTDHLAEGGNIVRRAAAATLPDLDGGWSAWADRGAVIYGLAPDGGDG
jgi:hypothetical protein